MNTVSAAKYPAVTPSRVQAQAGRTLEFLQIIEKTIDSLTENSDVLSAMTKEINNVFQALQQNPSQVALDPDGRVCVLLSQALAAIERIHAREASKRASAVADQRIHSDDCVVDAFDQFLASLSHCHDGNHQLIEWIETHDALLEPSTGTTYDSPDDLFKAILENL